MQKEAGTGEVRPSWIRKLQQQQEGTQQNKQKGNDPKQENKEKGRQESKKKAQSNIPKKKKPPLVKETETKPVTSSKEAKEKVKTMEEKAVDGKNLESFFLSADNFHTYFVLVMLLIKKLIWTMSS